MVESNQGRRRFGSGRINATTALISIDPDSQAAGMPSSAKAPPPMAASAMTRISRQRMTSRFVG